MSHLKSYAKLIANKGILLLSGFFENDIPSLVEAAKENNFELAEEITLENWAVLKFNKN